VPRGAAAVDVLAALVESPAPVELRAAAIRALGAIASTGAPGATEAPGATGETEASGASGASGARTFLLEHLRRLESGMLPAPGGPGSPEDLGELLLFERAALIESLAPLPRAPPWLAATWLRVPRAAARADLTSRLAGTRLPATEFRWRTELAFARAAAAAGELRGALEANEGWERIDGRCLAALGRAALATGEARSLESARGLLAAALVALAGEGRSSDLGAVVLATRRSAWLAAERAADWPATELHARRLLELRLRGEVPEVLWVAEFGVWDPVAGRDPEGRLRKSAREARSRIEADPRRR